jgi:hypothetical protein
VGTLGVNHETDTEETEEETEHQEPLVLPCEEDDRSGHDCKEGQANGLCLTEIVLVNLTPVLDNR